MDLPRCRTVVLAFYLTASPLAAGTITFEPAQPTTRDVLRVTYHEEDWTLACEPQLRGVAVRNDRIVITADPPPPCILIVTDNPYTFQVEVGPLPAGTYEVVVETVDLTYETVVETSEVTVVPAGRASGPGWAAHPRRGRGRPCCCRTSRSTSRIPTAATRSSR